MPVECQLQGQEATIVHRPRGAMREPYRPRAEVKRALQHKVTLIVLEMGNVRELASDELLEILACHIAAVKAQVKLVVRNCPPSLADLIHRSGIGNMVKIEESPPQG